MPNMFGLIDLKATLRQCLEYLALKKYLFKKTVSVKITILFIKLYLRTREVFGFYIDFLVLYIQSSMNIVFYLY